MQKDEESWQEKDIIVVKKIKKEREEDSTELDYSQKVRKLDNGNYMTDDGIVLLPSMKALNEIQTVVKMKVEQ